jgi:hypothetical protein
MIIAILGLIAIFVAFKLIIGRSNVDPTGRSEGIDVPPRNSSHYSTGNRRIVGYDQNGHAIWE